jgi:hypothetical protein
VHSRDEVRAAALPWLAALAALWLVVIMAGVSAHAAQADAPSEGEVARALQVLESDPNLATEEKRRIPKFFDGQSEPESRRAGWLGGLFSWIGQTGRVLIWVLGTILLAALLAALVRSLRNAGPWRVGTASTAAPTHVRELDVRPESLPAEIGPAAWSLWEQGEQRAALALLYRALVSRLIHVHGVPIRHSTTEAGCMELARSHLSAAPAAYVMQLVRCWQQSVYGRMLPQDAGFHVLCGNFDATLGAAANIGKPTP